MPLTTEGLQLIRNEIDVDPVSRGYSGKTAGEIAALMNEPISLTPQVYDLVNVNPQIVVDKLIRMQEWDTVKDVADNGTGSPQKRAFYFVELMKLDQISLSLEDTDLKSLVTDMVTDATITQSAANALRDMCRMEVLKSRREIIGLSSPVSVSDVEAALAL